MLWMLLLAAAAMAALYYRLSRRRLYQLAKEIPCAMTREYPLVGHAYIFLGSSEDRMKMLQRIGDVTNQQGGLSHMWLANRLFVNITDPKDIQVVSKDCLDKDEFTMRFMRTVLGNASLSAPVSIWTQRRKIMAPFFKLNNLKRTVKVFNAQSTIMADLMRSEVGRGDFPIWKYLTTYTYDAIGDSAMGFKMNSQVNGGHFGLRAVDEVTEMLSKRILQPWMHPDFVYTKLPVYKKFVEHLERSYDFITGVIQAKRKEFETVKRNGTAVDENGPTAFLDMMVQTTDEGKRYSDLELREEVMALVIAGNDTSAVGSAFTAVMMSRYPEVQDKVYQEVKEVFGDSDRAVTPEDLPQLKYLEAVIKESLRLYPPVPVVARDVRVNDVALPSGATLVDGTSVVFNIWGTHRNPAYWGADAEEFRPERFLDSQLSHPAQFIPFSFSARNCIGSTYAMMSTKTALANLLRRYRLLPPAGAGAAELRQPLRVKFDIMMKAVDNFVVRIEERNKI